MSTITVPAYTFTELPEKVQEKLIRKRMVLNAQDDWWREDALYDIVEALEIMGFQVNKRPNARYDWLIYTDTHAGHFSMEGSYNYKPGAVRQLKSERPTDTCLHDAAQSLVNAQKKHFYKLWAVLSHSRNYTSRISIEHNDRSWEDDFPEMKEAIEEVYAWALSYLEREYEWHTSEENARQQLEDEDVLYLIDGKKADKYEYNASTQRWSSR